MPLSASTLVLRAKQLEIEAVRLMASRVELADWSDIRPTKAQAAWCEGFTVTRGG